MDILSFTHIFVLGNFLLSLVIISNYRQMSYKHFLRCFSLC